MHVAIVGDGIGGRTLYRILKTQEVEADLYGMKKHTKCKIRPCGYGTSASCIYLLEGLGISPDKYVLRYDDYIIMDGRKSKVTFIGLTSPSFSGLLLPLSNMINPVSIIMILWLMQLGLLGHTVHKLRSLMINR